MEAIFEQIRRGGIAIMPDYTTYVYEPDGIFISHLSPSKLNIIDGELCEGHPHRSNGCCQFFYYKEFHEEEFPDGFLSHAHFLECYQRMIRHPAPNYLDYWWLTHANPADRHDFSDWWYCDKCEGRPDNPPEMPRYKCVVCKNMDICEKCYNEVKGACLDCNKRVTWMGLDNWERRGLLITHRIE